MKKASQLDKLMYLVGVGGVVLSAIAFFNRDRILLGIGIGASLGLLLYLFFQEWRKEKRKARRLKE